jgi:TFIIF-interacting CTD phosphatase-like protein
MVKNILLDLDQTLIFSVELDKFRTSSKTKSFESRTMDDIYITFARPHLQEFLDYIFKNFRVAVWTAASKGYAKFIIDNFILIKPGRKLDFVFYSYHCNLSTDSGNGLKGLNMLWEKFKLAGYNKTNTIIIDDNHEVKKIQVDNCYHIPEFNYNTKGSEKDRELLNLKNVLKSVL